MNIEPEDFIPDGVTFVTKKPLVAYFVIGPIKVIKFTGNMLGLTSGHVYSDCPAEYTTHSHREAEFLMGNPNIEIKP